MYKICKKLKNHFKKLLKRTKLKKRLTMYMMAGNFKRKFQTRIISETRSQKYWTSENMMWLTTFVQ